MRNPVTPLLLILLAMTPQVWADSSAIRFRVVSDDGSPLPGAWVSSGERRIAADREGQIVLGALGNAPHSFTVNAPGHYAMMHTALATERPLADVQLVQRKNGRRLLLFAGDAMLSRRYFEPRDGEPVLVRHSNVLSDGKKLLRFVKPYVELADVASVNLETQLSSGTLDNPLPKSVSFYSPAELAELLEWAGFDYAALGNNHTFDYRDAGVRATLKALDQTRLGYSGAGLNEWQARAPYTSELNGRPVSFLSYVGWPGTFTPTQTASADKGGAALGSAQIFVEDATALHSEAISVLQHHSGIEYAEKPALTERSNLRTAVDAGIDIAIGHHPHVLQGLEIYNDRLIAYSMGNFLFDQYIHSTQAGMLLYVWMDADQLHRAEVVPLNINGYVPTPATGAFRFQVLNRLARLSRDFGTCLNESGAHAILGTGIECRTTKLALQDDSTAAPISLLDAAVSPVNAITGADEQRQYRYGVDLLPRGDFESAGQYGVPVRAWLTGNGAEIVPAASGGGNELRVVLQGDKALRTGMKVFERAFRISNPATVSGKIRADGAVSVRFLLQRRLNSQGLDEALANGPLTEVGRLSLNGGEWQAFSLDHQLPRSSSKSIRLLVELQGDSQANEPVVVQLDDLDWIEWHTPWMAPEEGTAPYATHVQLRQH